MGGTDKVLAPIGGRPLLAWTLDAIAASPVVARIVVVASWANANPIMHATWLPAKVTQIAVGGDRRQQSVAAGFEALRGRTRGHARDDRLDRVVLVHDGARPLVSAAVIESVVRAAEVHGAAIPVLPVSETIKRVHGDLIAETIDRSTLATAQTPQGARARLLLRAYERFPPAGPETWTDEAALLEACRIPVHAVPGDRNNLKVTTPADLASVEAVLLGKEVAARGSDRVGFGSDSHPFGPEAGLALGGVTIERAPRLHGHSDGDVVLHAVADALLGAAGLGDLGRIFPSGPETPRGIASAELLAEVARRMTAGGYTVVNVDCLIVAARPRLGDLLPAIRDRIAELLGLDPSTVNVKASTGNLAGMEGAGRGISASAVAVLALRSAAR
jgi:2-C-methyl-D-erythritol 4-phosphate cytidylyltransferase / 2-C-methyl-D-erythritol 2,4-cyclodiphosphate synthase